MRTRQAFAQLAERCEQVWQGLGRDARAVVVHLDADIVRPAGLHLQFDMAAGLREADGVGQEVRKRLRQSHRVGGQGQRLRIRPHRHRDASGLAIGLRDLDQASQQAGQLHALRTQVETARLGIGERQHGLHQ